MYIKPFASYRYNTKKVKIEEVVSPTYDVIDNKLQDILYDKSPYNVVRLTNGKQLPEDNGTNKYTRAASFLQQFIDDNILILDKEEGLYLHTIIFTDPLTLQEKQLNLLFATLDLEESKQFIFPHEEVFEAPIIDRMNLLHATNANFGSVFLLYEDKEYILEQNVFKKIVTQQPIFSFKHMDNTYHRLYKIYMEEDIRVVTNFLRGRDGFIADGHHRYIAALKYYEFHKVRQLNPERVRYRLVSLTNAYDKNLLILPTHRVVYKKALFNSVDEFISSLNKYFEIEEVHENIDYETIKNQITQMNKYYLISFLIYLNSFKKLFKLTSRFLTDYNKILSINASNRLKNINTIVLHHFILPRLYNITIDNMKVPEEIDFTKSLTEAANRCKDKNVDSVIFLTPMKVDDLIFIAKLGEKIPQKTTYFYPKIPSGLVIYKF